jgi:hypothetical protein
VGWAEHAEPPDDAAVEKLAGDHAGLDGLAHTHVVGDQQPHRVEAQGHDQRHELVWPGVTEMWPSERNGAAPERRLSLAASNRRRAAAASATEPGSGRGNEAGSTCLSSGRKRPISW